MYLDLYIIENLLINYIIISCTSILTKNINSYKRKIIGAVVGTIYSVVYLFPKFYLLYTLPSKVIFIVIIGLISFVSADKNEFIRILTIFFIGKLFHLRRYIFYNLFYRYRTYKNFFCNNIRIY